MHVKPRAARNSLSLWQTTPAVSKAAGAGPILGKRRAEGRKDAPWAGRRGGPAVHRSVLPAGAPLDGRQPTGEGPVRQPSRRRPAFASLGQQDRAERRTGQWGDKTHHPPQRRTMPWPRISRRTGRTCGTPRPSSGMPRSPAPSAHTHLGVEDRKGGGAPLASPREAEVREGSRCLEGENCSRL